MGKTTRHPLYERADAFQSALLLHGFSLLSDGSSPELESSEWNFPAFEKTEEMRYEPVFVEEGRYALHTGLINSQLNKWKGTLPIRAITCGRVYNGGDSSHPCHTVIEGVIASRDISFKDYLLLWKRIAVQIYGIHADAELAPVHDKTWQIAFQTPKGRYVAACTGEATPLAKALLGTDMPDVHTWIFSVDLDAVTMHDYQLPDRNALYSPLMTLLSSWESDRPVLGDSFACKAADILRKRGYQEFSGLKVYESDCYEKMHMVQESWDANNRGIQLKNPLGRYTGLPTVLTPALEEALAANYKAGEACARLFEIGHIFLPGKNGGEPSEKLALSVGAYGPDIDKKTFKKEADDFLTELGVRNHFFIPTDLAIAYDTKDCWLVLDEKMQYLECNFGSINPQALANHGIGTQAFMFQMEIAPMERKAAEEYAFVAPELS